MSVKWGSRYDPKMIAAIVEAALAARKAGKPWAEAYRAGQAAGYRGSPQGLEQMIRRARGKVTVSRGRSPAKA